MHTVRVSVLIPFRNAGHYVKACIDSLQAQTLPDFEVIWVNDHSTDDTEYRVSQAKDPRFRIVQNQGKGIVSALNTGLKFCSAPYIARMDADDIMLPNRLAMQADYLDVHTDTGVVSGLIELFPAHTENQGYQYYVEWMNRIQTAEGIRLSVYQESPLAHPSVMFRTALIEAYGAWRSGDFPEDYELWLRWLEVGVRMHKLPVKVLYWRDHTERLSRKHAMYHASAFMRIKVKYLSRRIKAEGGNRPVWIWGAGKTAKQFAELLKAEGIPISGYVEVNRRKTGAEIVHYTDLGAPSGRIVLGHVGNRGAGDKIRQWLLEHNWTEGIDFWICA